MLRGLVVVVVHMHQITPDSYRLMREKRNDASQQLLPAKGHFQDLLGGGVMISYLSEVCYSAIQDILVMGFINSENTQDTLWVKIGLKRGKRSIFFIAGLEKHLN